MTTTITPYTTTPSRQSPATFSADRDTRLLEEATRIPQMNALATELNALAAAMTLNATTSTSTTSVAIGTGSKSLTVDTGKSYWPGQSIKIAYTTDPVNWMFGDVTSYNSGTGALVVAVTKILGSGTQTAWTVTLSGPALEDLTVEAASIVNQDLTTDASPTFVTVKCSGLTDLKIPKHVADATGFADTAITVTANNEVTNASQPAFLAVMSAAGTQTDVTGDNTTVTIICGTEIFDQNADYAVANGIFTAPVTGRYQLSWEIYISGLLADHNAHTVYLLTSNKSYLYADNFSAAANPFVSARVMAGSLLVDMDAADQAYVRLQIGGSTKVVDILGNDTTGYTCFSGYLVC